MLPTLAVGWQASAVKDEDAGCFRKVAGVSIVVAGSPRSVSRQLSGFKKSHILACCRGRSVQYREQSHGKGGQMLYS